MSAFGGENGSAAGHGLPADGAVTRGGLALEAVAQLLAARIICAKRASHQNVALRL